MLFCSLEKGLKNFDHSYIQCYHFVLITKISAYIYDIVPENLYVLISKKHACFGVKCLVLISIVCFR